MVPRQGRPLQIWKTFLRNHAEAIASIDFFVVPTVTFEQFFGFLVLGHGRRRLIWCAVTAHPTAEWLARQITEAFPWDTVPEYLIRDNGRAFGGAFKARIRAMAIRDPYPFCQGERNEVGRRECTDHLIRGQRRAPSMNSCEIRRIEPDQAFNMRHSLGMKLHVTSSAIGIASMALSSPADCGAWAFGTNPSPHRHLGKIALPND
jgi:hypothetical protein